MGSFPRYRTSWFLLAALPPLGLGGHTQKLNAPLPSPSSDVVDFLLDPSGTYAVYVADQDVPGVRELYSVPVDLSSPPIRLSDPMPAFGDVAMTFDSPKLEMSATGRVLYRADSLLDETFELFSVPADGSASPVRLNAPLVAGGSVIDWALSPDGTQVVYFADQTVDDSFEPFSVPVDGSAPPVALHPGVGSGSFVNAWVGPNGVAAYSIVHDWDGTQGSFELYCVPIDLSHPPALITSSTWSSPYHFVEVFYLAFSPDGQHLGYVLDETDFQQEFLTSWLAASDGSDTPVQLADTLLFTADGSRVVYRNSPGVGIPAHRLFSRTLDGTVTPLDNIEEYQGPMILGNDGATVFYKFPSGMYRVPADGSSAPTLLAATPDSEWGQDLVQSPDGSRVVYLTRDFANHYLLRSVPASGGTPVVLAEVQALQLRFTPDSSHLLFETPLSGPRQLFVVPTDGSRPPRRVHPQLPPGGSIWYQQPERKAFHAPTNEWEIYMATQETPGVIELFRAPLRPERGRAPAIGPALPASPGRF